MNRLKLAAVVLAIAFGASASAAQTAPAQDPPKQKPAAAKPGAKTTPDQAFAKEAASGGMMEVELGNLAAQNAEHADVKAFGQRMVTDHGKANEELKGLAEKQNMMLPSALEPKHKATRDRLAKLKGAAFDRAYMREMVRDHQQDVASFRRESKTGTNPELKAWATQTLPVLEEHMKMAKEISAKVDVKPGTPKK